MTLLPINGLDYPRHAEYQLLDQILTDPVILERGVTLSFSASEFLEEAVLLVPLWLLAELGGNQISWRKHGLHHNASWVAPIFLFHTNDFPYA